ncbi:MAG: hypothetical protein LBL83_14045 [Clostridiales bacterium]|jgi:pilus assembly protein CpaB|nr:hypothetical protein [Clostridiales bacterium]
MLFFKRKFIVGVICLAVSGLLAWKLLDIAEGTKETVYVLRVAQKVEKGAKITGDMFRSVEIGSYGVESGTLFSGEGLEGKYAAADLFPQDNLTLDKFTEYEKIIDNYVQKAQRDGKVAVSVTVKGISAAVSGKLVKGDVVSVLVFVNEGGQGASKGHVDMRPELAYMEIAAITDSKAIDMNYDPEREQEPDKLKNAGDSAFPMSVMFLADEIQALRLVEAENIGNIHLVFRGRGAYGESLLLGQAAGEPARGEALHAGASAGGQPGEASEGAAAGEAYAGSDVAGDGVPVGGAEEGYDSVASGAAGDGAQGSIAGYGVPAGGAANVGRADAAAGEAYAGGGTAAEAKPTGGGAVAEAESAEPSAAVGTEPAEGGAAAGTDAAVGGIAAEAEPAWDGGASSKITDADFMLE